MIRNALALVTFLVFVRLCAFGGAPVVVEGPEGYNCWPMIQTLGSRLICVYTSGTKHDGGERGRGTYARVSTNGGKTWGARVTVAQDPESGESPISKGLDGKGAALFIVRRYGPKKRFACYRTKNGMDFETVSEFDMKPMPMQITDVFSVPGVGLMAFWFGGSYGDDMKPRYWGVVTTTDGGRTWQQRICGENMPRNDWPTEPSGVWLGGGKILAVARTESGGCQFQLTSTDSGKTWKIAKTNFNGYNGSTPSLVYDPKTGWLDWYCYHRAPRAGQLRHCRVKAAEIFAQPKAWPEPEVLVDDHGDQHHSGNANAVAGNGRNYVAYYSGCKSACSVMVLAHTPQDR